MHAVEMRRLTGRAAGKATLHNSAPRLGFCSRAWSAGGSRAAPPYGRPRGRSVRRRGLAQHHRTGDVFPAPAHERKEHVTECASLLGERVGITHRALLVRGGADDARRLEALEALGKDI